jgi:hypothetical protein
MLLFAWSVLRVLEVSNEFIINALAINLRMILSGCLFGFH